MAVAPSFLQESRKMKHGMDKKKSKMKGKKMPAKMMADKKKPGYKKKK